MGPTLKQILAAYPADVKIVWKNNPLGFHKRAMPAALASYAAHSQGKFWEYHDKMFANARALEDADLTKYATELGLDLAKFKADMANPAIRKQIENEQAAAVALGQGGTPAFLINGKALSGAQPFDKFKTVIDEEIAEANKLVAAGTPLAGVHQARVTANQGAKAAQYMSTMMLGKAAPKPTPQARPVDTTVWKADVQGHEPVWGKADALVTIVEFSDFQCPFCTKVNPTLKSVKEKFPNDVRIVWKNNALPFHKRAKPAALASIAAQQQGKFWEMHDKLFTNQRALEDADLERYAGELGLDIAKYKAAMADPKNAALIDLDMDLATKVNARGTPNFFINGRNLRGAVPYEQFESLIEEELGKAKALVAAGTPAAAVYAKSVEKGKTFEPLEEKVNDFTLEGRPFKGNAKAPVTIIEYSDFQCPYCSRIAPSMAALTADPALKDRVKVVFKHFPLSFHKQATPAALASIAANNQGKFWEFHDKVFADLKNINDENLKKWAGEVGLDMAKYTADIAAPETKAILDKDMAEARAAGLRGTPSIYINGRKFQSTAGYSPQAFKSVIDKYFK